MRVVITGGGTGGHITPGLAIAEALTERAPDTQILFVGGSGLEQRLVPAAGWAFARVATRQVPRRLTLRVPWALIVMAVGGLQALSLLRRFRPHAVVATGGYAAAPVGGAAALLRIPMVLQEQNLLPGATNRFLSRWARRVSVPDAAATRHFPGKAVVTGVPLRKDALSGDRGRGVRRFSLADDRLTVLILGGSQGAQSLNAAVVEMVPLLRDQAAVQILHQTGYKHEVWVRRELDRRASAGPSALRYVTVPYIEAIGDAYACADLVVCRAGFGTLSEVTANGCPAIIVPYPYAADGHQEPNAEYLERSGAAIVLPDHDLTGKRLAEVITTLFADRSRLRALAEASRALGRPDAAQRVADLVLEIADADHPEGRS